VRSSGDHAVRTNDMTTRNGRSGGGRRGRGGARVPRPHVSARPTRLTP